MLCDLLRHVMRGVILVGVLTAETAMAQTEPVEFEPIEKSTVREALTQQAGQDVSVEGVVLRRLGPHTYLVHDGTAAVEVELPEDRTPPGGLAPNTRIRIRGGLVVDDAAVEIDVDRITYSF